MLMHVMAKNKYFNAFIILADLIKDLYLFSIICIVVPIIHACKYKL